MVCAMKKAGVLSILFALVLFAVAAIAEAQQPTKVFRVGYLNRASSSSYASRTEAFRQGLRDLGYVEGKNIVIEYRNGEGKQDLLPALTAELVRLKVDVIVTANPGATRSAKEATSAIPIVMTWDNDPVDSGFIASLARPGGNITGLSTHYPEISGKQLELLNEIVPKLSRVAILGTLTTPNIAQSVKAVELAAGALGVKLQSLDIQATQDIETAFRAATKGRADAVLVVPGPFFASQRKHIADLAAKGRLPAIYPFPEFVEAGGLISYSANLTDLFRRAATYVDKILKGAKPADLPVEQPRKFELVINLKAAKQIGLTIPPNVLARADRVIK